MKTHIEVLEETEDQFLNALISCDQKILQHNMHQSFIYGNDSGEIFTGFENLPILKPEILCVDSIEIIDRTISMFNNVALVLSFEKRKGRYMGIVYDNQYRNTRVWKFVGKRWKIIGAVSALI